MRTSKLGLVGCSFVAACGSDVVVEQTTSATGSGGAAATTTSSKSATSTTGSGFGGGFESSTSGAGGTSAACQNAFIDFDPGDGSTVHLVGSCPNVWGAQKSSRPVAYFTSGLAATGNLTIAGCLDGAGTPPFIEVVGFDVDTQTESLAKSVITQYVDANQSTWSSTQAVGQMQIAKMASKVGETVDGTFAASVTLGGQVRMVVGTFSACKVDDLVLP